MRRGIPVAVVCLVLVALAGVDLLATSIQTDGSVMMSTAGSGENGSFSSRAMAVDAAQLSRSVSFDEGPGYDLVVQAAGPVLISEVASSLLSREELADLCLFLDRQSGLEPGEAMMFLSGLMDHGSYASTRSVGSGLVGLSTMNGTGMVMLGSRMEGNESVLSRGFVSGNLSVRDLVRAGGVYDP